MLTHSMSLADASKQASVHVRFTHVHRTRIRLWLFGLLLKAAVAIAPMNVEVESAS